MNGTRCRFEIQLTSGGGQFLTVHRGEVDADLNFVNYTFPLTNASDIRILITGGSGAVESINLTPVKK